jgi:hypothetical protein
MTIGQRGHALVPAMRVSPGARKIAGLRECESFDLQSEKNHIWWFVASDLPNM